MPSQQTTEGIYCEARGYSGGRSGVRPVTLRAGSYAAAGLLVLALVGLAAGPSSGNASVAMWLLVLASAAILMGIVFSTQGVPRRLEEDYAKSLQEITLRFERLSARDWLTGLLTAAEFDGAAKAEFARSKRYGHRMSVAVIEPDKEALEALGPREGAGEAAARFMADGISVILRETDVLGQRDGFGVTALLPETDAAGTAIVAERILARFERSWLTLPDGEQIPVPVKVAVASYPGDAEDAATLLERVARRAA